MTERVIINFAIEREKRRRSDGTSALSERRRTLNSYYFHLARVRELEESLGVRQEPLDTEMARLAMRVCDLVLDSRDETDVDRTREMVAESGEAIGAYEYLRDRNGVER